MSSSLELPAADAPSGVTLPAIKAAPPPLPKGSSPVVNEQAPARESKPAQTERRIVNPSHKADAAAEEPGDKGECVSLLATIVATATAPRTVSFCTSTVVHMLLVILLALITFQTQRADDRGSVIVASADLSKDAIEDAPDIRLLEVTEPGEATAAPDVRLGATDVSLGAGQVGLEGPTKVANANFGSPTISLDRMAGMNLARDMGVGNGMATFFGIRSSGKKFVYVVDNSRSMGGGKFEKACEELLSSIEELQPTQSFYIYFFSDKAYSLFHPKPAPPDLVPANYENKVKVQYWLPTMELVLKTRAHDAVEQALAKKPDAIFLLTDGQFTDDTASMLRRLAGTNKIPIHTIGFGSRDGEGTLKEIAEQHHGTYRFVEVIRKRKKDL